MGWASGHRQTALPASVLCVPTWGGAFCLVTLRSTFGQCVTLGHRKILKDCDLSHFFITLVFPINPPLASDHLLSLGTLLGTKPSGGNKVYKKVRWRDPLRPSADANKLTPSSSGYWVCFSLPSVSSQVTAPEFTCGFGYTPLLLGNPHFRGIWPVPPL